MDYVISKIKDGQYEVTVNISTCLSRDSISLLKQNIMNISEHDSLFSSMCQLKGDTLRYTSETILPSCQKDKRKKILLVFGNPAMHSIDKGMFFFSKKDGSRHPMWRKLHKANLVQYVTGSNTGRSTKIEQRKMEASRRRESLLNGTSSEKYLIGLSTFYSFPTPVTPQYRFSNVAGVERIFQHFLSDIHDMEVNRLISYPISQNAFFIFTQKTSYETFLSNVKTKRWILNNKVLYWPAVSRKAHESSGEWLKNTLEYHEKT